MTLDEDALQKRRVIKWLAIGTGVIALIIGAIVTIGAISDKNAEQAEEFTLDESELNSAQVFATEFVTSAGTFGLDTTNEIDDAYLTFVKNILTQNAGAYDNPGFGYSRGERYSQDLIDGIDPNGKLDSTDYFATMLNEYYPDWSGQIMSYGASDVLITPGEAYLEDEQVLLPLQVSFTSTVTLFSDASVGTTAGEWSRYEGESFETIELIISLQPLGAWRVWDISELENSPFALATWAEPDWRVASPNKAMLQLVE